jgi:hypothetical protein
MTTNTCPRCGENLGDYVGWRNHDSCPYVGCDSKDCRALAEPDLEDLEQVRAAYEHWADHGYLYGCSHGA